MPFEPLVSIVIPVYNGANYMAEAIDSALSQTYPKVEVLVVNDGSNDGGKTEEIALRYKDRIRYLAKPNGGVSTALNLGIEQMKGDYFSWLSHDDVYNPNKIERQIAYLSDVGPDVIPYTHFDIIDARSQFVRRHVQSIAVNPKGIVLAALNGLALHGCTMLIKKSHFEAVGNFNPKLRYTQDYDMWFRMARRFPFRLLPEVLIKFRHHEDQGCVKEPTLDEEYWLFHDAIESLDDFDAMDVPDPARAMLTLAVSLARAPRRAPVAPVAYRRYLALRKGLHAADLPSIARYQLTHAIRCLQGYARIPAAR